MTELRTRDAVWRISIAVLVGLAGVLSILASGTIPPAPPAQTPVLENVFKPGPTLTTVGKDGAGEFQVLPSGSVIIWLRAPYPTGLEVDVDGVVLEQTTSAARRQALDAQGLGFWYHDAGSPDLTVSGDPLWKIVVAAAPDLRVGQRFVINLTNTSGNASSPRSTPLTVPVAIGTPDWVALRNNATKDNAVVLVDGRRTSGCVNDEVWRGKSIIDVGDFRSSGPCNEEVVVFSQGSAVQLFSANTVWTDSLRDFVSVNLRPLWQAPVTVWLLGAGLQTRAQADINRANVLYDTSRCGIAFNANFQNADNMTARNLVGDNDYDMCRTDWITALTGSAFFTPGRLNVYYIDTALFSGYALTCAVNRNIIVVGSDASNEGLAHEFGHSFSLGHSDGVSGIPSTNLMFGGGIARNALTKGQCFRASLNPNSTLNTNQARTGWLRDCPDGTTDSQCPALSFDVP